MIESNRTIIFDLSEVIIRGIVGTENELESMLETDRSKILSCLGGDNLRDICLGKSSEHEYFRKIIDENNWNVSIHDMKRIVRTNFDVEIPGMPDLVRELSKHSPLILYSDHAREWVAYIAERHPFLRVFEELVFSFNRRCLKSDGDAFPTLLQSLNLKPSDVIFVDDSAVNVRNAEKAGIDAILFRNRMELEKALLEMETKDKKKTVRL